MRMSGQIVMAALLLGCGGGDGGGGPAPVAVVTLTPGNDTALVIGSTRVLTAATLATGNVLLSGRTINWISSDPSKVSLSAATGPTVTVTALALGASTITASSEGKADAQVITVIQPVATVTLSGTVPDTLFSADDSVLMTAVARDANNAIIGGAIIGFNSSATAVATVNSAGTVIAVGNGTTNITASAGGTVSSPLAVKVRRKYVGLTITPNPANTNVGSTVQLSATPKDARGGAIPGLGPATFVSRDLTKATVTTDGLVSGVAVGTAVIVATLTTAEDGTHSDSTQTVVASAFPLTINVNPVGTTAWNPATVDIKVGGQVVYGSNGFNHSVQFTTAGAPANTAVFNSGTISVTFNTVGSWPYICGVHGAAMSGTVNVHP
jgi:plastocyanin